MLAVGPTLPLIQRTSVPKKKRREHKGSAPSGCAVVAMCAFNGNHNSLVVKSIQQDATVAFILRNGFTLHVSGDNSTHHQEYNAVYGLSGRQVYLCCNFVNIPYPTAFPYGNGMVLHLYQQQESSTTKTVHIVINKGLKTYV